MHILLLFCLYIIFGLFYLLFVVAVAVCNQRYNYWYNAAANTQHHYYNHIHIINANHELTIKLLTSNINYEIAVFLILLFLSSLCYPSSFFRFLLVPL